LSEEETLLGHTEMDKRRFLLLLTEKGKGQQVLNIFDLIGNFLEKPRHEFY